MRGERVLLESIGQSVDPPALRHRSVVYPPERLCLPQTLSDAFSSIELEPVVELDMSITALGATSWASISRRA